MRNEKRSTFFNAMPAPLATLCNGSSAMWNLMLILSVQTAQQSATSRQVYAVLHDVGIELRRCVLKC